jgi:hypothetical protein
VVKSFEAQMKSSRAGVKEYVEECEQESAIVHSISGSPSRGQDVCD